MANTIPYQNDGEEFRADLKAAGFVVSGLGEHIDKIKNTLGCSKQHARDMLSGWNRYSKPMRAKMKELIDSKHEPVADQPACKHCGETRRIVKANVSPGHWILCRYCYHHTRIDQDVDSVLVTNEKSQFNEPVDLSNNKFAVIDATDGTAVIVEIIAPFRNHIMARKLCQKLNDENQ